MHMDRQTDGRMDDVKMLTVAFHSFFVNVVREDITDHILCHLKQANIFTYYFCKMCFNIIPSSMPGLQHVSYTEVL